MLRQMRPDVNPQYQMMRMQNGGMGMAGKQGLVRAAMANNQTQYVPYAAARPWSNDEESCLTSGSPPGAQMMQQAKQNQMQRDPSLQLFGVYAQSCHIQKS